MNSDIKLRNIHSLSGLSFYVPDYQRGYRWTSTQALQMLEDFKEFYKKKEKGTLKSGEFYCLQPIVVRKITWYDPQGNKVEGYELIDGQQRLTTIYLILKAISKFYPLDFYDDFSLFNLTYETRTKDNASGFLNGIGTDAFDSAQDVDCYYMDLVYRAIETWLEKNKQMGIRLGEIMLSDLREPEEKKNDKRDETHNVRVIWYETNDDTIDTTASVDYDKHKDWSIEVFTRLNVGKIPLTNAELVKALFLRESNFISKADKELSREDRNSLKNEIALRQFHIAEEWNQMEQKLQDNAFWYFLLRSNNQRQYQTRIEYIFDLMAKRDENAEDYHTFNYFNDRFARKGQSLKTVEEEWEDVKKYFREIEYWFNDRRLFHLIGFLIEVGVPVREIMELAYEKKEDGTETDNVDETPRKRLNKDAFLQNIEERLRTYMADVDISKLCYGDEKMQPTLLLFNVLTVADSDRSDIKFPFDKYKTERWDKEHIASQTDHNNAPTKAREQRDWIDDMLLYFCGISESEATREDGTSDNLTVKERNDWAVRQTQKWLQQAANAQSTRNVKTEKAMEIVEMLSRAKALSIREDKGKDYMPMLESLFMLTARYFDRDNLDPEKKHSIGNMALLNASINRSYQNALFPIKRMHIKNNDSQGVFVPIATKNVFMKYYSKNIDNMMYWSDPDADDYTAAIYSTLKKYLSR